MKIQNLYPGSWGSNCYLLLAGTEAAVVDPSADAARILDAVERAEARLSMILLTHGHFDHILSLDTLRERTGAPAFVGQGDLSYPADAKKNAFSFFSGMDRVWRTPERGLADGDELTLGGETIRVLHTPGHTEGSVVYLCNDELLLTGDTLFSNNYGRYDLPGGDGRTLFTSLRSLRRLSPALPIYPGHGEPSILGAALDAIGVD